MKLDGKEIQGRINIDLENESGRFTVYHNANGSDPWSYWSIILTDFNGDEILKIKNIRESTLVSIDESYLQICNSVHRSK